MTGSPFAGDKTLLVDIMRVRHYRVLANHIFKNIPNDRALVFHLALGCLYGAGNTHYFELVEDKRLEQFQRHFLRQAALMQFELRADHDYRPSGIIHPFTQQILTEPSTFALDHIGK